MRVGVRVGVRVRANPNPNPNPYPYPYPNPNPNPNPDQVLAGLVGLDVTADGGALIVHPLFAPEALAYFRATRVLIRCREVEVVWDGHGRRYGGARGLS